MPAYYNENEPYAAQWLRNLISKGLIAPGDVDERSIVEVQPQDLNGYTQCHFFAGIGVWSYALRAAGWDDSRPVWTGSCPCQPFSAAGKRQGISDERHLWPHMFRLLREHRPDVCFGEQVASGSGLAWLDLVQADLEGENYAVGAIDTCAASVGAPHIRQRLYWVAHASPDGLQGRLSGRQDPQRPTVHGPAGCDGSDLRPGPTNGFWGGVDWLWCQDGRWRPVEPGLEPLAHGATARVGRLRAYGNAIVAPQAQAFVKAYLDVLNG